MLEEVVEGLIKGKYVTILLWVFEIFQNCGPSRGAPNVGFRVLFGPILGPPLPPNMYSGEISFSCPGRGMIGSAGPAEKRNSQVSESTWT